MLIPFGVLSAAGAGGVAGDYELISTEILTSSQSSITFSNLGDYSSTYKHLQLRATARSARTVNQDTLNLRLNGVTTSVYSRHRLLGTGSSVISDAFVNQDSMGGGIIAAGASATANAFSAIVMDILDPYSTTKNTTLRILSGFSEIGLASGLFNSTASLTQIQIFSTSGDLLTGTRMSLYGIKG
jgi:hypothetical protein